MDAKEAVTGAAKKAADGAQRMAGYEPQSRWQDDDDDDVDDEEWYAALQLLSHDSAKQAPVTNKMISSLCAASYIMLTLCRL